MKNIIHVTDGVQLNHQNKEYSDLVSNLTIFNQEYKSKKLSELEDLPDNSDYSNYQTLEELIERYDPETFSGKSFVVRVKDNQIWSSCGEYGGYDRPQHLRNESSDSKARENIREPYGEEGLPKGFRDEDCGTLNAFIRVKEVVKNSIDEALSNAEYECTLVKNMGNSRFWMKKMVSRGNNCEYLIKVMFHPLSLSLPTDNSENILKKYQRIESDGHYTDADNRAAQNEPQKIVSAYSKGKKEVVECINWLKKHKIEYVISKSGVGIMNLQSKSVPEDQKKDWNPKKDWITISSVQGLKDGLGNGLFKKYGTDNLNWTISTCKSICKITKEDSFSYSVVNVIALMFRSLTDNHSTPDKRSTTLFTKPQLKEFFEKYFESNMRADDDFGNEGERYSKLSDLSQSTGLKSWSYIAAAAFWPKIRGFYKKSVNKGQGVQAFSDRNPCIEYLVGKSDKILRKDIQRMVS